MSYESELLALLPVGYWRLDELSGTTFADSSGNGHDGEAMLTDIVAQQMLTQGRQSAIETDPSDHSVGTDTSKVITVPHHADFDIAGDLTYIIWARTFNTGQGRASLLEKAYTPDHGQIIRYISGSLGWGCEVTFPAQYLITWNGGPVVSGAWYMLAFTRSLNVLTMYANAQVVGQRTDLPTGDLHNAANNIQIGGRPFYGDEFTGDLDEAAIFDYALNAGQIETLYQAAINALLLNGRSNVIPTAILYSDVEPDPVSFPFRHNWDEPLIERISFLTNISKARTGPEENGMVRPVPRREIEIAQILKDDSERRKFRAKAWANQHNKWFIPIRQDQEQLAALLSAGVSTIPVSPAYKDYEVGSYIGIRQLDDSGRIVKSEELEINAVNESVDTATPTVNSYDPYVSYAYPVRRAYLDKSISVRGHTDSVEELTVLARLVAEDEQAVPNRITEWSAALTYLGYEVFDPAVWQSNNWDELREYEIERDAQDIDMDAGVFGVESDTPGAAEGFTYRMWIKGRAEIAQFLGWFYARAGSLNYLWVPSMQKDFEVISAASTTITVEGTEYTDNYALAEARRDVAFVYHDNTIECARITGFSGDTDETLSFAPGTTPTLTNLRSVSLLKFCRLDADQLEIAWETDDAAVFAWRFREMLTSPDFEGQGVETEVTPPPPPPSFTGEEDRTAHGVVATLENPTNGTITGNDFDRTSGSADWDATCDTVEGLPADESGAIEFGSLTDAGGSGVACGLTSKAAVTDISDIDFCMKITSPTTGEGPTPPSGSDGAVQVLESGTLVFQLDYTNNPFSADLTENPFTDSSANGDRLMVERATDGTIKYYFDGELVYTSELTFSDVLQGATAVFDNVGNIHNVTIIGAWSSDVTLGGGGGIGPPPPPPPGGNGGGAGYDWPNLYNDDGSSIDVDSSSLTIPSSGTIVYVNPLAALGGTGTIGSPYKTLRTAVTALNAIAGGTIVVRGGDLYDDGSDNTNGIISVTKPIKIMAYPGETVRFFGFKNATTFGSWTHDATYTNLYWIPYTLKCSHAQPDTNTNPPAWPYPEVVLRNRTTSPVLYKSVSDVLVSASGSTDDPNNINLSLSLQRLNATSSTTPSYFVDKKNNRLYINTNPSGQMFELSHKKALIKFTTGSANSSFDGIGVFGFATFEGEGAAVYAQYGSNGGPFHVRHCTFAWNGGRGVDTFQCDNGSIMSDNTCAFNGSHGAFSYLCDNQIITRNAIAHNNLKNFDTGWEGGGMKVAKMRNCVFEGNLFEYNNGRGLWIDQDALFNNVVRNVFHANQYGFMFELSYGTVVAGNLFTNNQTGIVIADAGGSLSDNYLCYAWNNTFCDNTGRDVLIKDGARVKAAPYDYQTHDISMKNNLFASTAALTNTAKVFIETSATIAKRTKDFIPQGALNNNGYWRYSKALQTNVIKWKAQTNKTSTHPVVTSGTNNFRSAVVAESGYGASFYEFSGTIDHAPSSEIGRAHV